MKKSFSGLAKAAVFMPCLAAFSEGDNFNVNLFGLAYIALLLITHTLINRHRYGTENR